jgi:hypothetical protein
MILLTGWPVVISLLHVPSADSVTLAQVHLEFMMRWKPCVSSFFLHNWRDATRTAAIHVVAE